MTIERETIVERPVERQTVVTETRSPLGLIGGVVAALLLVVLLFWLFGAVNGTGEGVTVDLPTVSVQP